MKLLRDDKAVSSVIGEVLMIAVVIVIAAGVVTFAYDLVWSSKEKLSVSILIEDAEAGASNITLAHMGGDEIRDAFAPSSPPSYFVNATIFENMEVKINGAIYEGWASLNTEEVAKPDFEVGDELELGLGWKLSQGDRIAVVYVPSGQVLVSEKV
jgi:flagellin-like protein